MTDEEVLCRWCAQPMASHGASRRLWVEEKAVRKGGETLIGLRSPEGKFYRLPSEKDRLIDLIDLREAAKQAILDSGGSPEDVLVILGPDSRLLERQMQPALPLLMVRTEETPLHRRRVYAVSHNATKMLLILYATRETPEEVAFTAAKGQVYLHATESDWRTADESGLPCISNEGDGSPAGHVSAAHFLATVREQEAWILQYPEEAAEDLRRLVAAIRALG